MNNTTVSICCFTFNQEKYIEEAIKSFLNQKANFKFEIIIHDDASTDKTPNIIKQYEEKYPNLITAIYQSENQYSKNNKIIFDEVFSKAKGEYIAICEGDDYWTDEYKIQKQFDIISKNKNISLVINSYEYIKENGEIIKISKINTGSRIFNAKDVISDKISIATSSMFFPKGFVKKMPKFYYDCKVGDIPLRIFLSLKGQIYYINDVMSIYRSNSINSWTEKWNSLPAEERINIIHNIINMYKDANIYSKYKYNFCFYIQIAKCYKKIFRINIGKIAKRYARFVCCASKSRPQTDKE